MKTYKIIARNSPLSQIQVQEFKKHLQSKLFSFEETYLQTSGDLDKKTDLMDPHLPDNFFTCSIDKAILEGKADIAIHSAKDLPEYLDPQLSIVALLPCLNAQDSLVSKNGLKLNALPPQSIIGTSSLTRQKQIALLRHDLIFKPIRGTIEERIQQVDSGNYDALIVAHCAMMRLNKIDRVSEILPIQTTPLQGHLAIVIQSNRSDLFSLFHSLDERKRWGTAHFIGFGPGHPDLITIKGDRIIRQANSILYDDLIDSSYIQQFKKSHTLHYVGKRGGKKSTLQDDINHLMYNEIIKGNNVVRLKGGDSSLFARLGEETSFLRKAKVHYDVIPGVTSTTAGAASAQISLTQRYKSSSLSILTAHHAEKRNILVPSTDTIAYLMGAKELNHLSKRLISQGKDPNTPVLLIQSISTKNETHQLTSIEKMSQCKVLSPVLILVGDIVEDYQPHKKLIYLGLTPPAHWGDFSIQHHPLIETKECFDIPSLQLNDYEGIIFTSQTAVSLFTQNHTELTHFKIASVGPYTTQMIVQKGGKVCCQPTIWDSDHLLKKLQPLLSSNKKWLYPCSNLSQNVLNQNKQIASIPIYQTTFKKVSPLNLSNYKGLFFTSPSTVEAFYHIYKEIPKDHLLIVQGVKTIKKLEQFGIPRERLIPRYV